MVQHIDAAQPWGLTGGIASGKSSVAALLRQRGAGIVDADATYHRLIGPEAGAPSALAQAVGAAFPGVLLDDGQLDRRRLGQLVFADAAARSRLEALTHPAVARASRAQVVALRAAGHAQVFYDVPLLFERGLRHTVAGVLLVWIPAALQKTRLMARDGLDAAAAEARLAAQWPIDRKRAGARWIVDNSGSPDATAAQVAAIWADLAGPPAPAP